MAAGMLIGLFVFPFRKEGGGSKSKFGIFVNKYKTFLVYIYISCLIINIFFKGFDIVTATLISVILFLFLSPHVRSYIPNDEVRQFTLFLLITMLTSSFPIGVIEAQKIIESKSYNLAEIGTSKLKFISHSSEYIFLLTEDNKTVKIIRIEPGFALNLTWVSKQP
jgi:hypothetical protein